MNSSDSKTDQGDAVSDSLGLMLAVVQGIGGTVGVMACLLNGFILWYVRRILLKHTSGYVIQLAAVSINDILNGGTVFLVSVIEVVDQTTIVECAVFVNFATTCITICRINTLFICIQKFIYVRKLRQTMAPWRRTQTIALVGVNLFIGIALLIANQTTLMYLLKKPVIQLCNPLAVYDQNVINSIPAINFVVDVVSICLANVLCCFTLWKLRSQSRPATVTPATSSAQQQTSVSGVETISHCTTNVISQSIKRTRQGAITFLLVVLSFDLSLLIVLSAAIVSVFGTQQTPILFFQLAYIFSFVNTILNPIIIMIRTQDIRLEIKKDMNAITGTLLGCFK